MAGRDRLLYAFAVGIVTIHLLTAVCRGQTATAPPASTESTLSYLKGPATWSIAEADCVAQGGHLASISSADENRQAKAACTDTVGCWIGLNDQATEGNYVWIDGSTSTYTAWATGQPDGDTKAKTAEDCVLAAVGSTTAIAVGWNDRPCSEEHGYLCKLPVKTVAPSPSPAVVASPAPANTTAGSNSTASNSTTTVPVDSSTGSTAPPPPAEAAGGTAAPAAAPSASIPATPATPAAGSTDSSSPASSPAASVTGSVTSQQATESAGTSSLAGGVSGSISSDHASNSTSTQSSGEQKDTWKLILSIVVPVLTGLAALITIGYTGWKWWHKRQATLMTKKMAHTGFTSTRAPALPVVSHNPGLGPHESLRSHNSGVKPLSAVGSDRIV